MNEKELNTLLAAGETEATEFKENLNDSFYKNIVAFSNTRGGTLLLGVDKKGIKPMSVIPSLQGLFILQNRKQRHDRFS